MDLEWLVNSGAAPASMHDEYAQLLMEGVPLTMYDVQNPYFLLCFFLMHIFSNRAKLLPNLEILIILPTTSRFEIMTAKKLSCTKFIASNYSTFWR